MIPRSCSCLIYTPEEYDTAGGKRFPVIYWLHGIGGGQQGIPGIVQGFDAAIRAGKMPPALVVFVNGLILKARTKVRQIVGDRDPTLSSNRSYDAHLTKLGIPHAFSILPGVGHAPGAIYTAMGEDNWKFSAVFGDTRQSGTQRHPHWRRGNRSGHRSHPPGTRRDQCTKVRTGSRHQTVARFEVS